MFLAFLNCLAPEVIEWAIVHVYDAAVVAQNIVWST